MSFNLPKVNFLDAHILRANERFLVKIS